LVGYTIIAKSYAVYVLAKLLSNVRLLYDNILPLSFIILAVNIYIYFFFNSPVTPLFPKLYPYNYMQVLYRYTIITESYTVNSS